MPVGMVNRMGQNLVSLLVVKSHADSFKFLSSPLSLSWFLNQTPKSLS